MFTIPFRFSYKQPLYWISEFYLHCGSYNRKGDQRRLKFFLVLLIFQIKQKFHMTIAVMYNIVLQN